VGGLSTQWWEIVGWREKLFVSGVDWWPVSQWVAVDRCRACFWWRAAGIQRAAWAGVVFLISRSIMERLIIGGGGVAVVGGLGGKLGGEVSELVGLSVWVGGGSCVAVVDGVVGSCRGGWSGLAAVVLLGVSGTWVDSAVDGL